MTSLAVIDGIADRIGGGQWAAGAPQRHAGSDLCSSIPGFPGPLKPFVRPLEELLELVTPDPGALYGASMAWEGETGDIADAGARFAAAANAVEAQLSGAGAEAVEAALRVLAVSSNAAANWTKVVAQSLQLCVTIFETVRTLVCEALSLLGEFADMVREVIFGSWPWELDKKADAIRDFVRDVDRFVAACSDAADNAMQAARELIRLLTDLFRALVPFHQSIEDAIGAVVAFVPGGTPPAVGPGSRTGPFDSQYNPSRTPYEGSDLQFDNSYPLGYQHSYELGPTSMTTKQLNEMFRNEFGHLFVPSRVGDNTQLNMQLTREGQPIETSLFGTAIPELTTGTIVATQIADDGFVIKAMEGHPEYPGEVAFRITSENGHARLQVTGAYDDTILGRHDGGLPIDTNPAYAAISDYSIWADMQHRIEDRLRYGS